MQYTRKKAIKLCHYREKSQQKQPNTNTPRFPSLQLNKDELGNICLRAKQQNIKQGQPDYLCFSFQNDKSNMKQVLQIRNFLKRQNLRLKDQVSVDQRQQNKSINTAQNKSVRSFHSLKQKLASRSTQKKLHEIKRIIKHRNINSLSNLLTPQLDSPPTRKSLQNKRKKNYAQIINGRNTIKAVKSTKKISSNSKQSKYQQKSSRKQIVANSFQLNQPKSININDSQILRKYVQGSDTIADRDKSFKSLLQKTKPVLQLKNRLLTNSKLQIFTRPYDDFQQYS